MIMKINAPAGSLGIGPRVILFLASKFKAKL